jgi:hypothetical protein
MLKQNSLRESLSESTSNFGILKTKSEIKKETGLLMMIISNLLVVFILSTMSVLVSKEK